MLNVMFLELEGVAGLAKNARAKNAVLWKFMEK
jgi:hypothetical protein